MSNPLHAKCYADQAVHATVEIVENIEVARATWRLRFRCAEMAARFIPGQFLMARLHGCDDPLIGRPFAMYDIAADSAGRMTEVDFVYLVKGKFTSRLCDIRSGQRLDVWGPLGNGFSQDTGDHLIMVAGGIGQTPFLALAQEALGQRTFGRPHSQAIRPERVTLCYGARRAEFLAGVADFQRVGVDVRIATDDGSLGYHGFVTDLLRQTLTEEPSGRRRIVCCGPEPMMERVAEIAASAGVVCHVSLETPMACGIGICYSCVARVKDGSGEWDYKRTCVEGPVFEATQIAW